MEKGKLITGEKMMNKNSAFINKSDCEKYQIIFPYRFLFGRRRENYLCSELEKLHPCFSDEFSFDSGFCSFTRKGIRSDVVVIHKNKLAEYEGKRKLSGTGFFIEDCHKHRYFVSEGIKVSVFACFLFLTTFLISLFFHMLSHRNKDVLLSDISYDSSIESGQNSEEKNREKEAMLGEQLIGFVKSAAGSVLFLRWKSTDAMESIEAKLRKVFPEQLSGMNINSVNYEKGIPEIQVSAVRANKNTNSGRGANGLPFVKSKPEQELCRIIREVVARNNGAVQEEKFQPYRISFSCNTGSSSRIFFELGKIFEEAGKKVSEVNLSSASDGVLEVLLDVGEAEKTGAGINLNIIAANPEVFMKREKKKLSETADSHSQIIAFSSDSKNVMKLGEIKGGDGKTIIYFKDAEGKIKRSIGGKRL